MERKIRNLLVATGVILSSAVALLPLTSYAVTGPGYAHGYECNDEQEGNECAREDGDLLVRVVIDPTIAIDMASGGDTIQAYPNMVNTGKISAEVRSASPYTISLSADEPYLTNTDDDSYNILPRAVETGKNAWGVKKDGEDTYTAISTVPQVFYSSDSAADDGQLTEFEVGVSISPTLPQGTYQTDVTITAAVKE